MTVTVILADRPESLLQPPSSACCSDTIPTSIQQENKCTFRLLLVDQIVARPTYATSSSNARAEAGKYSNWGKDVAHRRHCKLLGIFRDLWPPDRPPPGAAANPDPPDPEPEPAPFPWRLSPAQIKVLSARTKNIMWPHHMERMFYRGYSMWEKPSRMWKCRRKFRLLLFVLPVQLRDQVPPLRDALTLFAWTLRRLDGQVYSYATATVMGILPGSHVLTRGQTKRLHKDLIRSLVLLEGCVPVGHLIPTWHHFVHYAEFTETHGVLRWLWMMAFERLVCLLTHCYYCLVSSYVHNNHA